MLGSISSASEKLPQPAPWCQHSAPHDEA